MAKRNKKRYELDSDNYGANLDIFIQESTLVFHQGKQSINRL